MSILGLGTDIADIDRIEKSFGRAGMAFAKRILVPSELERFEALLQKNAQASPSLSKLNKQISYLAKRFSAKEAAAKALGTGIAKGVSFQDFEVVNDEWGKPTLAFSGRALEIAISKGVASIHLSIADEKRYAMATVILES